MSSCNNSIKHRNASLISWALFLLFQSKFMTTYLYGTALWTTMNFFNFMFVPRFHRILFIGCVEFLWTNVMCFMVDLEIEKDDPWSRLDPLSLD